MFNPSKIISEMFASKNGESIYTAVKSTIKKHGMRSLMEKGVLLGFSGGADSVMLLMLLHEYRNRENLDFKIVCAHINHGIRGAEADRDEEFSKSFCNGLADEFISVKLDVPQIAKESSIGLEEAARNARYSTFQDIIRGREDIFCISVAHNATDNAETVVFNMVRGAGLSGMCGIKPVRDNIIRPLISVSKDQIVSLLREFNISYVTDSTNLSNDYTRNYIRNEILPSLTRISSNPIRSISRMTENLAEDLAYIDSVADDALRTLNSDRIQAQELRKLDTSVFARVISQLIFEKTGYFPEEKHISLLKTLIFDSNFSVSLHGDYDFVCQRDICFFENKSEKNVTSDVIFQIKAGENKIIGTNLTVLLGDNPESSLNVYNFSIHASIASDIIECGLTLRFKRDGDAYKYGGVTHKLKKVFNDRNIPPYQRAFIPVLCDNNGIVFVPGLSVRDDVSAAENTSVTRISFCFSEVKNGEQETFTALKRL